MQKSTIRYFLISCFLSVLLISCGANPMKGIRENKPEKNSYNVSYFSNPDTDYVYRTNISVYGNELSGILIFKKINDSIHRIVFTTEFGNKLMDFEIGQDHFKTNFIVEELDRKILINTLREDFGLLLKKNFAVNAQFDTEADKIFQAENPKGRDYLYEAKSDGKLYKIARFKKRKQKFNIGFTTENNIFAEKIIIRHFNIKLKIELNALKNQ